MQGCASSLQSCKGPGKLGAMSCFPGIVLSMLEESACVWGAVIPLGHHQHPPGLSKTAVALAKPDRSLARCGQAAKQGGPGCRLLGVIQDKLGCVSPRAKLF